MKKKIIVFTGSRADYGLLKNLIINLKSFFNVKLVAGSQHFSKKYNYTYKEITKDGLKIDCALKFNIKETSKNELMTHISLSLKKLNLYLNKKKPEIVILLGDRYEVYAAALCCYLNNIQIAHIHGGELTYGSFDDGLRHSITKFANLHFVSHKNYRKRIIQMGEKPKFVYNFGAPGAENAINYLKAYKKNKLIEYFNIPDKKKVLITYHPETKNSLEDINCILNIFKLIKKKKNFFFIFTNSNSDPEGLKILKLIKSFCHKNTNCIHLGSLGHKKYLQLMSDVDLVLGNSSSGIIEASTLKILAINIGTRQAGRLQSNNIINCKKDYKSLLKGFDKFSHINKSRIKKIFYKKNTSKNICNVIKKYLFNIKKDKFKEFYDIKKK
jgi:GDP/UDP-N,N'-diacetylbacillosamine 2-epimerase (hydrolysing)